MQTPLFRNACGQLGWAGLLFLTLAVSASAAAVVSKPPVDVPLRPVAGSDSAPPASPTYEIALKWNDRSTTVLTVPLKNDSDKPLKVLGVQATRGIFVSAFPGTVGAKKEDNLSFVYSAADNTDGDTDLIRVLTDGGIKEIVLKIVRDEAVRFDVKELSWLAGSAPDAKSATITVTAGTALPIKARATGGNIAVLEPVNATTWRVKVTPASTAKSGQFAVFVDFDQALPGRAPVILGIIQPKE